MSLLERLPPSASTVALTVGTGLPTLPLGLTESMMMAPPDPPRPPSFFAPDPVRLVVLLEVRSTTFFGFGTRRSPPFRSDLLLRLLCHREALLRAICTADDGCAKLHRCMLTRSISG